MLDVTKVLSDAPFNFIPPSSIFHLHYLLGLFTVQCIF